MYKIICGFLLAFSIPAAIADCISTGCDQVYVDLLYVNTAGTIYIGTSGDESKLSCPAASGNMVVLDITQPGGNAIYSLLLTAQTSNKKIYVRVDETSNNCKVLYATLNRQ